MTGILWSFRAGGKIQHRPTLHAGILYAAGDDRTLYALDADTGGLVWRTALAGPPTDSPTVGAGTVYVTGGSRIQGFDAGTGAARWELTARYVWHTPTVDADGNLLVIGWDSALRDLSSVDPATGTVRWRHGFTHAIRNNVTVAGDAAVLNTHSGSCYCYDTATGERRWATSYGSRYDGYCTAAIAGDDVWAGSGDGEMLRMRLADGKITWSWQTFRTDIAAQEKPSDLLYGQRQMRAAPSVLSALAADDAIYFVLRNGHVYCFDRDGRRRWSELTLPRVDHHLSRAGGLVLARSSPVRVRAWDALTGEAAWKARAGSPIVLGSPPLAAGDRWYVGSGRRVQARKLHRRGGRSTTVTAGEGDYR